ncbi:MAG TPA: nitronate monooxygenase [Solirubrobacterales bacterium]|nr:nitronate monooxygenase [Solirubrobacterales bacterium]
MIAGVEYPVVQAGMGGGLANHQLAAAVSEAGGLGQIGILPPDALREELEAARGLTAKPIAINLIVPFARRAHWEVAREADAIVTHWELRPRRRTSNTWLHTVGSAAEARAAVAAGADAVIAQGVEAGGHVRGTEPVLVLLERVRAAVPAGFPVLVAGGIAEAADVRAALELGATGAVAGTRFLATDESGAHPEYKARVVQGAETILTELFGMGWPRAPHRVLPNEATRRWIGSDPRGRRAVRLVHGALSPVARWVPVGVQLKMAARASATPLDLAPPAPLAGMPAATVETHPLYAGETARRIDDVRPAGDLVRELTP